uniref:F-actin-monooxygenase MICAL2 isoform X9 n=1 Tax=Callithrix jacchus TaxID=9483 RepID=UPI0023DD5875|nr:F-actin-monooxygenase MICAL2 isoform X9 [Callithrix jacchus]XP_054098072.1 F-actin-monooxygenase MICAL2 isoform X9 [Callithrix jacchus]XP_054098073.1 F-actin-monooxygenase MICAL2 isoform X9 [Callithrix jacchus]XP_054098074.1 F-actin-monooxygenase MICAL2 isoform X9 [Callithrix jacchus]
MGENEDEKQAQAGQVFENFVQASTCKGTLQAFNILTRQLDLDPLDHRNFYSKLKSKVTTWKAKALWYKLDKRGSHKEYKRGKSCTNTRCLIVGGGPCGLRTAIELAYLGAKVVVVEKRDTFSRNNVLHLWPFTIHDLRGLGAKKFYGKFCAGSIDHISIRQLQLILFKVALMLGVEIHVNVEFVKVLEPPEDQENQKIGWRAEFLPADHCLSEFEFDVIIGADGRRNTLEGFRRKEFRGKLAIAITANFINRNSTAEAKVEEISGVAFIFNQKFFQDLKEETGIDLENIVYYKDCTHYFVMTAKKQSLLDKGVIINDYIDTEMLLCAENVNQDNLLSYAREAADFATNYQLPSLDFAMNHYGQPDVAMFDFTSMYASENAALVRERQAHQLLVALVGDSLLEPFWPMGTGCARGFLAAFDTAWMVKNWNQGTPPLELLAERESLYRLLPQTTPENINKNFEQYTLDPGTRYPNLNSNCVRPHQVKHLYITKELDHYPLERLGSVRRSVSLSRRESDIRPSKLLTWCQQQTEGYQHVNVTDLTTSWRSGLALCAIIHRFRPELINFDSLNEDDAVENNQLAFDVAEREFGIPPVTTGKEMASAQEPDKLSMVMYLSKFYELFRGTPLRPVDSWRKNYGENADLSLAKASISNNYLNLTFPRKRTPRVDGQTGENDMNKRRRKGFNNVDQPSNFSSRSLGSNQECGSKEGGNQNKVKSMANQLLAKFEESTRNPSLMKQESMRKSFPLNLGGSDTCYFCKKRVYVMERLSAEGHFFHRECFRCSVCATTLRLAAYTFDYDEGKFYCKPHFIHCKANSKQRKRRAELKQQREEEATWQEQEAPRRDTPTESSCAVAAIGTPEGSPPDEPTSPKKPKSISEPQYSDAEGDAASPLPSEWTSVRISPGEDAAGQDVLAVRVLVTSEDSSSDTESDYGGCEPSRPEPCEEKPRSAPLSLPHASLRKALSRVVSPQCPEEPKAVHAALQRANSFQSPTPSKYQNWRREFRSSLTPVNKRTMSPPKDPSPSPPLPSLSSRSSSPSSSATSVSGNGSSLPQLTASEPLSQVSRGHPSPPTPTFGRRAIAQGAPREIPLYLPHHPEPECAECCLGSPDEDGISDPAEMISVECQPAEAPLGDIRSKHRDPHPIWEDRCLPGQELSPLAGEDQEKGSTETRKEEEGGPVLAKEKPGLKKLVLTQEQKTMLLDWNDSVPERVHLKAGERLSQKTTENSRGGRVLKPVRPLLLPGVTREPLPTQRGAQEETGTPAEQAKGERSMPPPRSPLRLIANAIWRSLEPLLPNSEGGKRAWAKPESKTLPTHISTRSFSLRKTNSNKDRDQHSPGRNQSSALSPPGPALRTHSLPNRPSKIFPALTSPPCSKIEDVPTLLEKVSLQETFPDASRPPKKRISLFSSLRLKDKSFESFLQESRQRKDIREFFSSPKREVPPEDRAQALEKLLQPFKGTSLCQAAPPPPPPSPTAGGADSKNFPLRAQVTEASSCASSTTSSSADEEFDPQLSLQLKEKKTLRRRKKLEKAMKQLVKQEELKRLYKAQAIQRQLEEVEERQRASEIQGVRLEKALRGEAADSGTQDEAQLLQEWFKLVLEKNKLMRYESELLIMAQELELEDHQSRLEQKLREKMLKEESQKDEKDLNEEQEIFTELMQVITQRDKLVNSLEEQRVREKAEDQHFESFIFSSGCQLSRT